MENRKSAKLPSSFDAGDLRKWSNGSKVSLGERIAVTDLSIVLWGVWFSCSIISESNLPVPYSINCACRYACVAALFLISFRNTRRLAGKQCVLLFLLPLLVLQAYRYDVPYLVELATLIFAFRNHDLKQLFKASLFVLSFWILTIVALSCLGYIAEGFVGQNTIRGLRSSFGFKAPSRIQTYILVALCLYLISYKGKLSKGVLTFIFVGSLIVSGQTDARYPLALTIVVVIYGIISSKRGYEFKLLCSRRFLTAVFPVAALISILLPILFNPDSGFWMMFDDLLSGRLVLSSTAVQVRELGLFGSYESANQYLLNIFQYGYFDCGFLNFLYSYGVIPFVGYIYLISIAMKNLDARNPYIALFFVVIAALSLFYSHAFISMKYGIALLATSAALEGQNKVLRQKETAEKTSASMGMRVNEV